MNRKKVISSILILGIVATIFAYKLYNKPHIDVAKVPAEISISAINILEAFSSNETTANPKYLDKIIEVNGIVLETKLEKEKGIVSLKTSNDFGSVLCHLSKEATKSIVSIKEGQSIKLKGICTGYLMDVILVKCEIIN